MKPAFENSLNLVTYNDWALMKGANRRSVFSTECFDSTTQASSMMQTHDTWNC